MFSFFIRRTAQTVAFLFVASLLLYSLLVVWYPGGPSAKYKAAMIQKAAPAAGGSGNTGFQPVPAQGGENIERAAKEYYKVDRPWPLNYFLWLFDPQDTRLNEQGEEVPTGIDLNIGPLHIRGSGVLTGDFGESNMYSPGTSVGELLDQRSSRTAWLVIASLLISILIAVPIGVLAAARQNSGLDTTLTVASVVGLSMPTFLLGLMLIIFLAVLPYQWHHNNGWSWLPYLPPGSVSGVDREDNPFDYAYHLVLPATALAAIQIGIISRYVRFSMLEVLGENYIRTAFAKGVSMRRVLMKHALKNALLPLITTVALALPGIMSGLIIVEMIFGYPGLGQLFYFTMGGTFSSAQSPDITLDRDFSSIMDEPVVLIVFLLMLTVVAVANTVADLLYAASDPRITFGSKTDS